MPFPFIKLKKTTKLDSVSRRDGFENVLTGLNTSRDKSKAFNFRPPQKLSYTELDWHLRFNPLAFKVCNKLPSDATKKTIKFTEFEPDSTEDKYYHDYLSKILNIYENISLAGTWENGFGGAVIILNIDDGQDPSMPVNIKKIKSISSDVIVLDRYQIYPENFKLHNQTELYYLNKPGEGAVFIHESRLLVFRGSNATNTARNENKGWSDSILSKYLESIQYYVTSVDSCNALVADICQGVYKIQGLNKGIGNKDYEEKLIRKYTMIDQAKSIIKAFMIDSEDDYQRISTNVSGLKDLVQIFKDFLAAVMDMPHNILLNEAPAASMGSNSGTGEMETWENTVSHYQINRIQKHFERVLTYIAAITNQNMPAFVFESIEPVNEIEAANIDNKKADTELKRVEVEEKLYFIGAKSGKQIAKQKSSTALQENKKLMQNLGDKPND